MSRVVKKFTHQSNQSQYLNKPKTFQIYGNFLDQSRVTSKLIEKVRAAKDRKNRSQALPIVLGSMGRWLPEKWTQHVRSHDVYA